MVEDLVQPPLADSSIQTIRLVRMRKKRGVNSIGSFVD
jgi:hypothetical protein